MDQGLSRDDILAIDDQVVEPHTVAEWSGRLVYVRSLSAAERGEIEGAAARFKETKGKDPFASTFTVTMAWMGLCDSTGKRLFENRNDIVALQKKNAAAIAGIAEHVQRLSGFSKEELEELEKNSLPTQPAASLSD